MTGYGAQEIFVTGAEDQYQKQGPGGVDGDPELCQQDGPTMGLLLDDLINIAGAKEQDQHHQQQIPELRTGAL